MKQLESRKGKVEIDVLYYDDLKAIEIELNELKEKEKKEYNEIGECLAKFIVQLSKSISHENIIMECMTAAGYEVTYTDNRGGKTICGRGDKKIQMIKK